MTHEPRVTDWMLNCGLLLLAAGSFVEYAGAFKHLKRRTPRSTSPRAGEGWPHEENAC
jgi:hypothetical protein